MDKDLLIEGIKDFLFVFPYNVMHEKNTHNEDVFFVVIDKADCKSNLIKDFFTVYEEDFKLKDLSSGTMNYIKEFKNKFFFVYIEKIKIDDPFYKEKVENIKKNANNILAIRTIGIPADQLEHWNFQLEQKIKQTKVISKEIFNILSEETKNKLNEITPKVKKKIKKII